MMYTKQELKDTLECLDRFEQYKQRDVYTIVGVDSCYGDIITEFTLVSSVDTRDNPVKSLEELEKILSESELDFTCNLSCDIPPELMEDILQFDYSSYKNKTLFAIFIDYEFGSNNEEKINSLLEKYYGKAKDKDEDDEIMGIVIDKLCKL